MSKTSRRIFTEEFKREAVRQTQTSGLTIVEVAANPGIGLSSLTRWKRTFREADLLSGPHMDVTRELARLRKENDILRATRSFKKSGGGFNRSAQRLFQTYHLASRSQGFSGAGY